MMLLVESAVGGVKCRVASGKLGYGGWFGFGFLILMMGKIGVGGGIFALFSSLCGESALNSGLAVVETLPWYHICEGSAR